MKRQGFTLLELLIVIAILAIVGAMIVPFVMPTSKPFDVTVIDKWTDFDGDGTQIFRCRVQTPEGEVYTLNTYWNHDSVHLGQKYKITTKVGYLSTVEAN